MPIIVRAIARAFEGIMGIAIGVIFMMWPLILGIQLNNPTWAILGWVIWVGVIVVAFTVKMEYDGIKEKEGICSK